MLLDDLKNYHIILASRSPRRRELLTGMGICFETQIQDIEECYPKDIPLKEIPSYLAALKLTPFNWNLLSENTILIGCDTLVFKDDEIMGKARNEAEMIDMLKHLSGEIHEVVSGICLKTKYHTLTENVLSKVKFKKLTDEEIQYYIRKYQPIDKAGSYGVQEWIGYIGIEYIEGSFYNVMGFPTAVVWNMLQNIVFNQL